MNSSKLLSITATFYTRRKTPEKERKHNNWMGPERGRGVLYFPRVGMARVVVTNARKKSAKTRCWGQVPEHLKPPSENRTNKRYRPHGLQGEGKTQGFGERLKYGIGPKSQRKTNARKRRFKTKKSQKEI